MSTALEKYKIIFETRAVSDLKDIVDYIAVTLKEPETAKRIYSSIKKQLISLDTMPYRHTIVSDEPFCKIGLRKIPVENYTAFYFVGEENHTVHIVRILYNRREWQNLI